MGAADSSQRGRKMFACLQVYRFLRRAGTGNETLASRLCHAVHNNPQPAKQNGDPAFAYRVACSAAAGPHTPHVLPEQDSQNNKTLHKNA